MGGPGDGQRRVRRRRLFDYGELRLLILYMISDRPSHGYELIKDIEERFGGSYSPSPGVIYPTLTWLEDMGFVEIVADAGSRKRYEATGEGRAFLKANRASLEEMKARGPSGGHHKRNVPAPVIEAMENLKAALRQRFREGGVDEKDVAEIAALIDVAARAIAPDAKRCDEDHC